MITRKIEGKKEGFVLDVSGTSTEADLMRRNSIPIMPTNRETLAYYNALVTLGIIKGDLIPVSDLGMHSEDTFNHSSDRVVIPDLKTIKDEDFHCGGTVGILKGTKLGKDLLANINGFPSFIAWSKGHQLSRKIAPSLGTPTRSGVAGFSMSASDGFEMLHQLLRMEGDTARIVFGPKDGVRPEIKATLRWDKRHKDEIPEWMNQEQLAQVYGSITAMIEAMQQNYNTEMSRLQREQQQLEERARTSAMRLISQNLTMLRDQEGWELTADVDGRLWAIYPNEVHCTHVAIAKSAIVGNGPNTVVTIELPENLKESLYIKDIKIRLDANGISSVTGRGHHPHCMGGRGAGDVCVGDFRGQAFTELSKFVEGMKIVNFHSMFSGEPSAKVHTFVAELRESGDFKKTLRSKQEASDEEVAIYAGDVFTAE